MRKTWISLVVVAMVPYSVKGQVPLTPAAVVINGTWAGTLVLDNSSPRLELVIDTSDSLVTGKVYSDGVLMGPMEDGSRAGNKIHFKLNSLDFTGVVAGSRMTVDLIVYNGTHRALTLFRTPDMKDSVRKPARNVVGVPSWATNTSVRRRLERLPTR